MIKVKRWLLLALGVLTCLAITFVGWHWLSVPRDVTQENSEKIRFGMKRDEVIKLLGQPHKIHPGDGPPIRKLQWRACDPLETLFEEDSRLKVFWVCVDYNGFV